MDVADSLPEIANKLSQKARATGVSATDLEHECPWLCQQIIRDAATPGLFDLWSGCCNFDEIACVNIVEPNVLAAIGELARTPMNGPNVHAGLQHTYGYLLSTILTPFGYKRDRWVSPLLEQAFGLPPDILGPNPTHGTLLANATLFAGSIAFRGDDSASERLRQIELAAAASNRKVDFDELVQSRIVESVALRDSGGRFRSIRICTDLVNFPHQLESAEKTLLVYSITDSSQPGARLTTLFPVTPQFVEEFAAPDRFGTHVEIRTRFNAYVPGLTGQTIIGRRELKEVRSQRR